MSVKEHKIQKALGTLSTFQFQFTETHFNPTIPHDRKHLMYDWQIMAGNYAEGLPLDLIHKDRVYKTLIETRCPFPGEEYEILYDDAPTGMITVLSAPHLIKQLIVELKQLNVGYDETMASRAQGHRKVFGTWIWLMVTHYVKYDVNGTVRGGFWRGFI